MQMEDQICSQKSIEWKIQMIKNYFIWMKKIYIWKKYILLNEKEWYKKIYFVVYRFILLPHKLFMTFKCGYYKRSFILQITLFF